MDYGPTANFVAGHLVACQRSVCYFFEGMTRSSRMLHSYAESWSVVHVRWEVVEEKFYQRLFSGTPCIRVVPNFDKVRTDPRMVAQLRTTFLKLAAAMEGAMVRLGEAGSRELYPVSQYYSSTLVTYIRTVLQVRTT